MKIESIFIAAALMFGLVAGAHAYDPKATIADLDSRLAKIGVAKIDGTEVVADKTVPALFFGDRKINSNYDVVDACYNPIKDAGGKIIGVSYVGHKK